MQIKSFCADIVTTTTVVLIAITTNANNENHLLYINFIVCVVGEWEFMLSVSKLISKFSNNE